jgi:pre-mRNA-processing factor 19
MLETFTLKKQLETTREELSHALYQSDASCRVIARLLKERDTARRELEQLRQAVGRYASCAFVSTNGQRGAIGRMDVENVLPGLDAEARNKITVRSQDLSTQRRERV